MEAKDFIKGALSTAYQLDDTGVASLFNEDGSVKDDALDTFKELDEKRVSKLKGDPDKHKKALQDQYSRGKRETMEGFERDLKDKFGTNSDKQGIELVEEILAAKQPKGETLTDDAVKKHPLYLQLERAREADKQEHTKTLEAKLKEKDAEHQRERITALVLEEASTEFEKLRPILSKDPERARNQRKLLEDELRSISYQVEDNGGKRTFLLLDKEGNRLEDKHGHPITLAEKVKDVAGKYYDFQESEQRSSAGDPDKGTAKKGANGAFTLKKPTTRAEKQAEMARILDEVKDPKQQAALYTELEKMQVEG